MITYRGRQYVAALTHRRHTNKLTPRETAKQEEE